MLAGPSCSGKTDLARYLQAALPDPWLFWEADKMQPPFPRIDEFSDRASEAQMLDANLHAIRAYVDAGFNVIAEIWLWYPEALSAAKLVFAGLDLVTVSLDCELPELERREAARGTTLVGTARRDFGSMSEVSANLVLDAAALSTHDLGDRVAQWLEKGEAGVGLG